jgi:hypothetical protein
MQVAIPDVCDPSFSLSRVCTPKSFEDPEPGQSASQDDGFWPVEFESQAETPRAPATTKQDAEIRGTKRVVLIRQTQRRTNHQQEEPL